MNDNEKLIEAIKELLPDAPFKALEFVYYFLLEDIKRVQ